MTLYRKKVFLRAHSTFYRNILHNMVHSYYYDDDDGDNYYYYLAGFHFIEVDENVMIRKPTQSSTSSKKPNGKTYFTTDVRNFPK